MAPIDKRETPQEWMAAVSGNRAAEAICQEVAHPLVAGGS